jgi:hypothetical protein
VDKADFLTLGSGSNHEVICHMVTPLACDLVHMTEYERYGLKVSNYFERPIAQLIPKKNRKHTEAPLAAVCCFFIRREVSCGIRRFAGRRE